MRFFKNSIIAPETSPAENSENSKKSVRRGYRGFTLVELVVVIAVLAILAGVGAVAYRGYIKKAKEAADLELLSAVNTAFQAACMDEGMKTYPVAGSASATLSETKAVEAVATSPEGDMTNTFNKYYKGNESKTFQVYQDLIYVGDGLFSGVGEGNIKDLGDGRQVSVADDGKGNKIFTYRDTKTGKEMTYKASNDLLEKYANSTFGKMAGSDVLNAIDMLTMMLGKAASNSKDASKNPLAELFGSAYGLQDVVKDSGNEARKQLGNAGILYIAEQSNSEDFNALEKAQGWADNGFGLMDMLPSSTEGMTEKELAETTANLALAYAMAASYANSDFGNSSEEYYIDGKPARQYFNDQIESINKASKDSGALAAVQAQAMLKKMFNDPGFKEYYGSSDGQPNEHLMNDVNGYLSAMQFISENKGTLAGSDGNDVVQQGFGSSNKDIGDIFDGVFK